MQRLQTMVLALIMCVMFGYTAYDIDRVMQDTDRTTPIVTGDMPTTKAGRAYAIPNVPDNGEVIHDYVSGVGTLKYTKTDLANYIRSVNYKISDTEILEIVEAILESADVYGISPTIIIALMDVESDFRPRAVSPKGARGLLQILPRVWLSNSNLHNLIAAGIIEERRQAEQIYDISKNVRAGTYVLAHYRDIALANGDKEPMIYALTRYLGGSHNNHSGKTYAAVKTFASWLAMA